MYTDYKSIWIIKKGSYNFSPNYKEKLYLDYDAAIAASLELEEQEIRFWEARNKTLWVGNNERMFPVITLDDAFDEFESKIRDEAYDDSYSNGYRDGKDEGYDDGYSDGKREGYDEGYEAGKTSGPD